MASSKIKGLTVEIGGDTTKLGKALEAVEKKSRSLSSELKGINRLLKLDPNNITLLKQKQDLLTKSIQETREKLKTLKSVQKQVNQQWRDGEIGEEQFRDFQREIQATRIKLQGLKSDMREFGSVSAQVIADAGKKVESFGGKVESAGQKLKGVSTGAGLLLVGASKGAIDFESAWAGVTKTVDGTEEELNSIKQGILDLAQSTASSAEDIAAVAETAGQLGIATEDVLAFTETMVRLGDSTNLSADEAASSIARIYNIMGGDMATVDAFGASLVDLGNNFATTEAEILAMATRLSSAGNQMGMSEQDVLALATTLSAVGMEAEAGGSAISQIMIAVDKAVATNDDTLKTWAETTGMSVKQFKKLWGEDATGALQAVFKGLGDASAGGENLNLILDELGITTIRQTDTMRRLASASGLLGDAVKTSNEAWKENSALTTESDKRYQTTAAQIQQLKGAITELCVTLGATLLPIINKFVEGLTKLANWFTQLPTGVQTTVLAVLALVTALAPLLIVTGKVISAVGIIMQYAPQIATVCKAVGTAFSTLASLVMKGVGLIGGALKGLFALILAHPVIAVIVAIVAAVVLLYNKCEWFRNAVHNVLNAIGNFFKNLASAVVTLFTQTIPAGWNKFLTFCSNFVKSIGNFFKNLPENLKSIGKNMIEGLWNGISGCTKWLTDKISGFCSSALSAIKSFFGIKSPSRVMRDQVGKMLGLGMAEGITDSVGDVQKAMNGLTDATMGGFGTNGFALENNLRQRGAQMAMDVTAKSDLTMQGKLDKILSAIERGQVLMLDGKALVGHTASMYDNTLGQRRALVARGAL